MTQTLLAHLAGKLSSRHEDIAVEALGYILKSEAARNAAVKMLEPPRSIGRSYCQIRDAGQTRGQISTRLGRS